MKNLTEYFVRVSFYKERCQEEKEEFVDKELLEEAILFAKETVNNAYNDFTSVVARIYRRNDYKSPDSVLLFESHKLTA